jgi:Tol biopolymer transport system component
MYHAATKTVDIAVRTMTSSFGSMRWVTSDATHDELSPAWSPDGARIAYALNDGSKIRTVYAKSGFDGGIAVEDVGAKLSRPSWSPDGARMAAIDTRDYDLVHLEGVLNVDVATGQGEVVVALTPGSYKGQISWTN